MPLEDPGGREMQAADQRGLVRIVADVDQVDLDAVRLEDEAGARDRELADPALAEAAAHDDPLGAGPGLGLEEAPQHQGKLLRVLLDRALDHGGAFGVALVQDDVELGAAELVRGRVAERVLAELAQRLAPVFQNGMKGLAARPVAQEALVVLQLEIVAVDLDRRQGRCPMPAKCRRGVGHENALREPAVNVRDRRNVSGRPTY